MEKGNAKNGTLLCLRVNLYELHTALHSRFRLRKISPPDKWAAIAWMCSNQLGRRNISDVQKTVLIAEAAKAQKLTKGGDRRSENFSKDQSGPLKAERARVVTAKQLGVGFGTVQRAEEFLSGLNEAEKVSPGIKESILSGEVKAPKKAIAAIRNMDDDQKREAVERIKSGEAAKKAPPPVKRYNGGGSKEYREMNMRAGEVNTLRLLFCQSQLI